VPTNRKALEAGAQWLDARAERSTRDLIVDAEEAGPALQASIVRVAARRMSERGPMRELFEGLLNVMLTLNEEDLLDLLELAPARCGHDRSGVLLTQRGLELVWQAGGTSPELAAALRAQGKRLTMHPSSAGQRARSQIELSLLLADDEPTTGWASEIRPALATLAPNDRLLWQRFFCQLSPSKTFKPPSPWLVSELGGPGTVLDVLGAMWPKTSPVVLTTASSHALRALIELLAVVARDASCAPRADQLAQSLILAGYKPIAAGDKVLVVLAHYFGTRGPDVARGGFSALIPTTRSRRPAAGQHIEQLWARRQATRDTDPG
jgi:hypothetical protein